MDAAAIVDMLCEGLGGLTFGPPVEYVYNPLLYARVPHLAYWRRYGGVGKRALLLGMNPGPWGMAQTGVPFGEVDLVSGWLGVKGKVGRPEREHEKRPVEGFSCKRHEVSGQRLWGWAKNRFVTPERFFEDFFVINYCPLMFMEAGGKNRTPDKLPRQERAALEGICDDGLRRTVELLRPGMVIGVGGFAAEAARRALSSMEVSVGRITHPSPANPAANKGWEKLVEGELKALGVLGK